QLATPKIASYELVFKEAIDARMARGMPENVDQLVDEGKPEAHIFLILAGLDSMFILLIISFLPLTRAQTNANETAKQLLYDSEGNQVDINGFYQAIDLTDYVPIERSVDSEYPLCDLPVGSGVYTGVCVPPSYYKHHISFCKDYVFYQACIPPQQPLWPDWHVTAKDEAIELAFKQTIDERMAREMSENGDQLVEVRFSQNIECVEAFRSAVCRINFPKCNESASTQHDSSYNLCTADCLKYFQACKFDIKTAETICSSGWPFQGRVAQADRCTGAASQMRLSLKMPLFIVLILIRGF
ncbi:hypothetical protein FOL47_001103, partial [Perkinsus chesapeaki]